MTTTPEPDAPTAVEDEIELARFITDPDDSTGKTMLSLWYYDGNIVLQAESVVFRCYQGMLEGKAYVFKDMFDIPQPPDPEMYDGCRLVRLPDKALDLYYFLQAIYDYEAFCRSPSFQKFSVMAGILRLAAKYGSSALRVKAIQFLLEQYPTSLAEYTERGKMEHLFEAIRLARDHDLTYLLPAILYECCSKYSAAEIVESEELSLYEKKYCLRLREHLISFQLSVQRSHFKVNCNNCTGKKGARISDLFDLTLPSPHPLALGPFTKAFPSWKEYKDFFCEECFQQVQKETVRLRGWVWGLLTRYIMIAPEPSWEDLLKKRDEDLADIA